MLLISEIKLKPNEDEKILKKLILNKLKIKEKDLLDYKVYKKSTDARKEIVYKYQVLVNVKDENKYLNIKNVTLHKKVDTSVKKINSNIRPIIIGYGPSGIFSTYRLVEAGLKPIVFEKGKRIDERVKDVEKYFKEGILDTSSNVQFGEGGAGTFSDCKLTTRIKDPYIEYVLDTFIKFGANENIKYTPHAHIGTDKIREIVKNITNYLIENGAEFHFQEEFDELILDDKHNAIGIKTNKGEYHSSFILLGIGHSGANTIKNLDKQKVDIIPKDMAIGFRVEHPQSLIDKNQFKGHENKEACEYFLRYKDIKGVYSFCMCPGGLVVPSSSDLNRVVTNGMSYSLRDSKIANSAILIQVNKEEYGQGNLAGFDYIKHFEEKAYNASNSYKAIACNIKDYLNNEINDLIFPSTYSLGTILYNFNDFFKESDNEILHRALLYFDTKINGFIENGIMVGPETRSSCPIRIRRDENYQSINTKNLYPMGEGAGYGGGITSCALDGIRIANKVLEVLTNNSL